MTREGSVSSASERRDDEVSLRDLYLVLLRGLPFVLLLALVAGGVAYYLNAQRRPVYAAESTVLVTPPPIQIEGDENLSFSPINEVSFQTYETLARSQLVLNDAAARVVSPARSASSWVVGDSSREPSGNKTSGYEVVGVSKASSVRPTSSFVAALSRSSQR